MKERPTDLLMYGIFSVNMETRGKAAEGQTVTTNDLLVSIKGLEKVFNEKLEAIEDRINISIQQAIRSELDKVKQDLSQQLQQLEDRVNQLEERLPVSLDSKSQDRSLNVVIRNLAEAQGENVTDKVNDLVRNTLKIQNLEVESAERKRSFNERKTGVIIATFKSKEDKEKVMKGKSGLGRSRQYKTVYIDHDKSPEQRRNEANLRLLVNTVAKDSLHIKGSRIVKKNNQLGEERNHRLTRNQLGRK